ncbi:MULTISPECIES: creatininase family protein [unclassified Streptosporangium]|uniref:creatininase family protein n=1 Tax=unclassified Streptosporangium TaxID=2632669 RepID=UPI002E2DD2DE|nr:MULTISPECIES: creatininase family protein [unclassified Streptosporangium]
MLLGDLSWPDFESRAHDGYAIVPVGAVEPHGPHLPLATDTMISEYFARRLAADLDGGYVTPSIGYGVATPPFRLGGTFPGVISISGSTFMNLIGDVLVALARDGVRRFVIVNSAIDNVSFLCEAARLLTAGVPHARVMIVNWWDVVGEQFRDDLADETGVARDNDHHAALVESSLVMHIAPDSVQPDQLSSASPSERAPRRMRYHVFPLPADATTDSGIVYIADKASAGIGERVAEQVATQMRAAVRREFADHDQSHQAPLADRQGAIP